MLANTELTTILTFSPHISESLHFLWLVSQDYTYSAAAKIVGISRSSAHRIVLAFRKSGLDGIYAWNAGGSTSELDTHKAKILASLTQSSPYTAAQARERIVKITGITRTVAAVRSYLRGLGWKWRKVSEIPLSKKTSLVEHNQTQEDFVKNQLQSRLDKAKKDKRIGYFLDAAHFILGASDCHVWSLVKKYQPAGSGRQRVSVLAY